MLSVEDRLIIKQVENAFHPCVVAYDSLNRIGILELYDNAYMTHIEKSMYREYRHY